MTGSEIRKFFRDLFGSRLVERLEEDLLHVRADFEARIKDKDETIATLREDVQQLKSKVAIYELAIMPSASVQGAAVVAYQGQRPTPTKPNFAGKEMFLEGPPKSKWQMYKEQEEARMKTEFDSENKKAAEPAKEVSNG